MQTSSAPATEVVTPSEVASMLGDRVTARTVSRWCRAGRISTIGKLGGTTGAWLIGPEGIAQARELVGEAAA